MIILTHQRTQQCSSLGGGLRSISTSSQGLWCSGRQLTCDSRRGSRWVQLGRSRTAASRAARDTTHSEDSRRRATLYRPPAASSGRISDVHTRHSLLQPAARQQRTFIPDWLLNVTSSDMLCFLPRDAMPAQPMSSCDVRLSRLWILSKWKKTQIIFTVG